MPRPRPFSQPDLERRKELTGLTGSDAPADHSAPLSVLTPEMREAARGWDVDPAVQLLGIKRAADRDRYRDELLFILVMHKQEIMMERQETPGRFEAAVRNAKRRLKKATINADDGTLREADGRTKLSLKEIPNAAWQEAQRRRTRRRTVKPGRYKSAALRNTLARLQALANHGRKKRRPYAVSRKFIEAALDTAGIPRYPKNPMKLASLMISKRRTRKHEFGTKTIPHAEREARISSLEKRLRKAFL